MHNAYLSPDHELLREQVARFLAREVEPQAAQWERDGMVPRAVLRRLGEAGLLGLMYEPEYGGGGADALMNLAFADALADCSYGGFVITVLVHTDMASPHLHHGGSAAQKARWMPGVCRGETICAVAVTEPGAGSDVAGIRSTARRDGADYVIDGAKTFITNGVHADLYFVAARSGPGKRDISIFAVERGTPGLRVGRQLDKTGWRSSDTAELQFDACRVPASHLLGQEHRGFYAVMKNFQTERIALAAMAVGHCRQAIRLALEHVRTRQAFGATLWDKQAIRQRLAMCDARRRGIPVAVRLARHPGPRHRAGRLAAEGAQRRAGERGHRHLPAVPRRHGLHDRHADRAPVARCACARHRRRCHRGHARRGGQALLRLRTA